jgi:hypothetical protein
VPFSFLHPLLFVAGAACIAIPIIIHLLKRRRRVISWGAMRFLEEAYRKRRRIITLEQLILLSLRCLLILFIALGVGSIVFGEGGSERAPKTLVVVLDDSIASARIVNNSSVIDRNIDAALQQIGQLDPLMGDRVAMITAASPARALVLPASDDLGSVRAFIEESTPTDSALDFEGVLALVTQIESDPDRPTETELFFATDARGLERAISAISTDPSRVPVSSVVLAESEPSAAMNVGILSATPTRSLVVRDGLALPESVRVELVRSGDVDATGSTRVDILDAQGAIKGSATVAWRVGERATSANIAVETRELKTDAATSALLRVRTNADANPRDNEALIAIPTRNTLRVAVIDRPRRASGAAQPEIVPSRWVRAALAPRSDMGVQLTSIDASQAAARLAPGVDAVFVLSPAALSDAAWDRLTRLRDQGVMIIVTPDTESDSLAWFDRVRQLTPDTIAPLRQVVEHTAPLGLDSGIPDQSLLSGIDSEWDALAGAVTVTRSLSIDTNATPIATLTDTSPVGVQVISRDGSGVLVILAVPFDLSWSNLPARPLFVAMLQELVRQGVGLGETRPPTLAGQAFVTPDWAESTRPVEFAGSVLSQDMERSSGAVAFRDGQGQTRGIQVVHPDAMGAVADRINPTTIEEQLARFIDADAWRWIGAGAEPGSSPGQEAARHQDAHRLGLWMLWVAMMIGAIEFVLARVFTQRLIASERAMGAEGRGVRA